MSERHKHHYVSQDLVRNWSEDGKKASWCSPIENKSIINGGVGRFFHTSYIDDEDELREPLAIFDTAFGAMVSHFLDGDFEVLGNLDGISGKEILLMQLYQTPMAGACLESLEDRLVSALRSPLLNGLTGIRERNEYNAENRKAELQDAINKSLFFGLYIRDLVPVLLKAPEKKKFILGASPVSLINPYIRRPELSIFEERDSAPYMDKGTLIVIPLSPSVSFCLYDSDVYSPSPSEGICPLTEKDVDKLNMIQIYNSGYRGGVIHAGDEKNIHSLIGRRKRENCYRSSISEEDLDHYPFNTVLSVFNMKKNENRTDDDTVREFTGEMLEYDGKNIEKLKGDDFWEKFSKRNSFAEKTLEKIRKK